MAVTTSGGPNAIIPGSGGILGGLGTILGKLGTIANDNGQGDLGGILSGAGDITDSVGGIVDPQGNQNPQKKAVNTNPNSGNQPPINMEMVLVIGAIILVFGVLLGRK